MNLDKYKRAFVSEHFSIVDAALRGGLISEAYDAGRNMCCPFHADATPSFHLYFDTNRYYCFGCTASGGAVDLYAKLKGEKYFDVLEDLFIEFGGYEEFHKVGGFTVDTEKEEQEKPVVTLDLMCEYPVERLKNILLMWDEFLSIMGQI